METTVINCSGMYLSESIIDFPFAQRGEILFFDKGRTGCGGTTFAGTYAMECENIKVVILMPSVASVMSKQEQEGFKDNTDVQFLYGKLKVINGNPKVVFATYDKIKIIVDNLKGATTIYKLLIDEYHTLTRDADFREIMKQLVIDLNRWDGVTFMSATPEIALEEAIGEIYTGHIIRKIKAVWDSDPCEIHICPVKRIIPILAEMIYRHTTRERCSNLYIFFNNITSCNRLIERCGLSPNDYHFLSSPYTNRVTHRSSITEININPRKINFITAAGFEGLDILDPNAQAVLVIDMSALSTIFDCQTIIQMMGRCRESDNVPIVLYHQTKGYRQDMLLPYQQQYERLLEKKAEIECNPGLSHLLFDPEDIMYIGGKYVLNPFSVAMLHHRIEIFENMQSLEKLHEYLTNCGFAVKVLESLTGIQDCVGKRISFKKLVRMYVDGIDITGFHDSLLAQRAVKLLGLDKIQELGFKIKAVERALSAAKIEDYDEQIKAIMGLNVGMTYTKSQIRSRIESVNGILNVDFNTTHLTSTLIEMGYLVHENHNGTNRGYTVIKSAQKNAHLRHKLYISHVNKLHFF